MTSMLTLDSKAFCRLINTALKNRYVKKIMVRGHGTSMAPFIKSRDLLTIKISDSRQLKIGDIAAVHCRELDKIIVHRIIGFKNNYFQTKGDNNPVADQWISKNAVIGVIIKIQRHSHTYYPKRWSGFLLAILSKTLILNIMLLPAARYIKKKLNPS